MSDVISTFRSYFTGRDHHQFQQPVVLCQRCENAAQYVRFKRGKVNFLQCGHFTEREPEREVLREKEKKMEVVRR